MLPHPARPVMVCISACAPVPLAIFVPEAVEEQKNGVVFEGQGAHDCDVEVFATRRSVVDTRTGSGRRKTKWCGGRC